VADPLVCARCAAQIDPRAPHVAIVRHLERRGRFTVRVLEARTGYTLCTTCEPLVEVRLVEKDRADRTPLEKARELLADPEVAAVVRAELADRKPAVVVDCVVPELDRAALAQHIDRLRGRHDA